MRENASPESTWQTAQVEHMEGREGRVVETHKGCNGGTLKLPCQCGKCGTPWAEIRDGVLIVRADHHGNPHENRLTLAQFVQIREIQQAS
jgi:hypothetical protein